MINLLNKPLRSFVLYSAMVLLASTPIYFVLVDNIWLEELDENNEIIAGRAKYNLAHAEDTLSKTYNIDSLLYFWNIIQPNSKLVPRSKNTPLKDSIYTIYRGFPHSEFKDIDRFRVLETPVNINGKPYTLIIKSNVEETYETAGILTLVSVILVIIICVGFMVLNRRISAQIWTPFRKTLLKIEQFKLEEEALPKFEPSGIVEFENLNKYILQLMEKNIEVFKMQKEFIENVSHEIQTPLAIIQNKLNLILQTENIDDQQFYLVENANKALSRAIKINKSLLLLTKIESGQFTHKEEISIGQEVRDIIELLSSAFAQKNIKLDLDIDDDTSLKANRQLVLALIQNLITNALKYTPENGIVSIQVKTNELILCNSGKAPLQQNRIFRRFISLDGNIPGTGIGLALVKEICEHNNWSIDYLYSSGQQLHCFKVVF